MKHSDFYQKTKAIKEQEYAELYTAIKAHGNCYRWDLSAETDYPIIAVNVDGIFPNPADICVYKVSIENHALRIYGVDKEYGHEVDIKPEYAFAGHPSFIIDHIIPTNEVEAVTSAPEEDFPVAFITRHDVAFQGYDISDFTNDKMRELARKMGYAYLYNGYWEDMKTCAEAMGVPRKAGSNHQDKQQV